MSSVPAVGEIPVQSTDPSLEPNVILKTLVKPPFDTLNQLLCES